MFHGGGGIYISAVVVGGLDGEDVSSGSWKLEDGISVVSSEFLGGDFSGGFVSNNFFSNGGGYTSDNAVLAGVGSQSPGNGDGSGVVAGVSSNTQVGYRVRGSCRETKLFNPG